MSNEIEDKYGEVEAIEVFDLDGRFMYTKTIFKKNPDSENLETIIFPEADTSWGEVFVEDWF